MEIKFGIIFSFGILSAVVANTVVLEIQRSNDLPNEESSKDKPDSSGESTMMDICSEELTDKSDSSEELTDMSDSSEELTDKSDSLEESTNNDDCSEESSDETDISEILTKKTHCPCSKQSTTKDNRTNRNTKQPTGKVGLEGSNNMPDSSEKSTEKENRSEE